MMIEVRYQNTREDFKAYFEQVSRNRKASQRSEYYQTVFWYLGILGLAGYIAFKHGEVFVVAVFGVLAAFYVQQNWSFKKRWDAQAEAYADMNLECSCQLVLDDAGATERFSGIQTFVPWSEMHDYTLDQDRLFIHYLQHRAMIVSLRHLAPGEADSLIAVLETRNVRKKTANRS